MPILTFCLQPFDSTDTCLNHLLHPLLIIPEEGGHQGQEALRSHARMCRQVAVLTRVNSSNISVRISFICMFMDNDLMYMHGF